MSARKVKDWPTTWYAVVWARSRGILSLHSSRRDALDRRRELNATWPTRPGEAVIVRKRVVDDRQPSKPRKGGRRGK